MLRNVDASIYNWDGGEENERKMDAKDVFDRRGVGRVGGGGDVRAVPRSMGLHVSHSVEGSVLEALADALGVGEPTAEELERLKFLSYARTANTPPRLAGTFH